MGAGLTARKDATDIIGWQRDRVRDVHRLAAAVSARFRNRHATGYGVMPVAEVRCC